MLAAIVQTAQELALNQDADSLSMLGPALVGLVMQARGVDALPSTATMDAWAAIAADLGAIIGQAGLTLTLPPDRRAGMIDNARAHAVLLDDATGGLFALTAWLDEL